MINRMILIAALAGASLAAQAQLGSVTNSATFYERRMLMNATAAQTNTNQWDIATNVVNIAANAVAIATNAIDIATNAVDIAANTVLVTTASNGLTAAFTAADTITSNAYVAADTVASNGLTAAFAAADTITSNAYVAADTVASNGLTTAFTTADTAASNGLTTAFTTADTALSNGLIIVIAAIEGVTATAATNIAAYVVSASNSLYATAAQGSTANSAMQPADGTAISNAFLTADTVISNALAGAGGAATVPVSPYALEFAYTFDTDAPTQNWWAAQAGTNTDMDVGFDVVQGGYVSMVETNPQTAMFQSPSAAVTTPYTVFVKYKTETTGSYYAMLLYAVGSGNTFYVLQNNADSYVTFDYNGTPYTSPASSATAGAWHTITITMTTGDGMEAFIDGASFATSATPLTWTATTRVGEGNSNTGGDAQFSSFYFWNRELSTNEITRLHTLEIAGQYGVQGLRRP